MNLSRKWLAEYTDITASDHEFAEALTLSGSKVEGTADLSADFRNVVVGRVTSIERHPDSDHMWITMVDVGKEADIQIVTGAQNVKQGDLVPVAMHDSLLPGGVEIKKVFSAALNQTACSALWLSLALTCMTSPTR